MKNIVDWFFWIPRVLCIMAILFVSMFALDAFAPGLTFMEQVRDFLIHLIPTYILIVALLIAWKWEKLGGIILMAIGLWLSPFVFQMNWHRTDSIWVAMVVVLMINIPFIAVGALFIISHYLKKKTRQ